MNIFNRIIAQIKFIFTSPARREKIFTDWLVDQALETGLMPPPELLTREQYERFQQSLKLREEYESLFQEIPFPERLTEGPNEIYRQD